MDKRGSIELVILGIIVVIAIVGLVMLFSSGVTGKATGPVARGTLATAEPLRIVNPGGYSCGCDGKCAYTSEIVRARPTIDSQIASAETTCRTMLESICGGQPILSFNFGCGTR